jgi:hypothetical protein
MQRVLPVVVAGLTAVALVAPAAQAAAPRIVIVSGKPMAHQIVISSWTAIFRVVEPVASAPNVKRTKLVGGRAYAYRCSGDRGGSITSRPVISPQHCDPETQINRAASIPPGGGVRLRSICRGRGHGRASSRQRGWRYSSATGSRSRSTSGQGRRGSQVRELPAKPPPLASHSSKRCRKEVRARVSLWAGVGCR